ncbi:MAG TPA: response regulator [Ktedonobacteraceae bacterium]|nr:response regulator [Ktedonobacteraceae bacterium]
MSQQWRILVVEGDEYLNQGIVNSLLKDGYNVQGVLSGAEAIRTLWADEHNLVIGDMQLPDADGFDLLQWIRTYRPQTRMIMLAAANLAGARTRALENGAVGYLEKPVDLRLLKVEVRRLLQQTGFTASLASFDLLDVIQIVNMSRKSISLVVHTGLEEQGMLGFQAGEMIWAEYGTLRGEEAFFALAAHKNGTVTQQAWDERVTPNVKQPLARLIMQALQYRSKYAAAQQLSGELEAVNTRPTAPVETSPSPVDMLFSEAIDDRPFTYVAEQSAMSPSPELSPSAPAQPAIVEPKEWWQDSARIRSVGKSGNLQAVTGNSSPAHNAPPNGNKPAAPVNGSSITPSTVRKTNTGQRSDLPSWLMDQPTQFELQALRPSSLSGTGRIAAAPASKPSPAEWQPEEAAQAAQSSGSLPPAPAPPATNSLEASNGNGKTPFLGVEATTRAANVAEWQAPHQVSADGSALSDTPPSVLQSLVKPRQTDELSVREANGSGVRGTALANPAAVFVPDKLVAPTRTAEAERPAATRQPGTAKRNYAALVSALQTLGYTLRGFIASAIVGMDGQPIAQVAMEDQDISGMCGDFSVILKSALLVLQQGSLGQHDDTIITSATHHILLRVLDRKREVFQVLITTRESDPVESLEVMATVESAIVTAL